MDQNTAVAAPKNNAAKFVFFYALELVSLGFMAVSFGIILFQIINKDIADALTGYSGSYDEGALKFAISALLVSTPIFYVVGSFIQKSLFTGELKKDSGIRRWLTYLILFASFLIFVGWLIAFVYNYLNGEVTLKFILKTLSVLVIAATVFGFYLYDIRREAVENIKDKTLKIFFIATLSAVVIVFIASFFIAETPAMARDRRLDSQVVNNFYAIDNCTSQYYGENEKLPASFNIMQADCQTLTSDLLKDSQTGKSFDYQVTGTTTYQICANFRTSNVGKENNYQPDYSISAGTNSSAHEKGYQCLKRQVYPVVKTN
jgi:type II secretory pathway pseudopilin PulG